MYLRHKTFFLEFVIFFILQAHILDCSVFQESQRERRMRMRQIVLLQDAILFWIIYNTEGLGHCQSLFRNGWLLDLCNIRHYWSNVEYCRVWLYIVLYCIR